VQQELPPRITSDPAPSDTDDDTTTTLTEDPRPVTPASTATTATAVASPSTYRGRPVANQILYQDWQTSHTCAHFCHEHPHDSVLERCPVCRGHPSRPRSPHLEDSFTGPETPRRIPRRS
jgi:hypothetical protein